MSQDLAIGVWSVVSPFIAAGLAAWLGYYFGVKKKQEELLVSEKFERLKTLSEGIANLEYYCEVRIRDERGSDIGPSLERLPKDAPQSPLQHAEHLHRILKDAMLFLSAHARQEIRALIDQVWRVADMELKVAADPTLASELSALDSYTDLAAKAETCIETLHHEARSSSK